MDPLAAILRILHILFGALWVGAGAFVVLILDPLVPKMGAKDAHSFTRHLYLRSIFQRYFPITAGVATLAGFILYGVVSAQDGYPMDSAGGIVFHVGVVAGVAAAVWGGAMEGRLSGKLAKLSAALEAKPSKQGDAEMGVLLKRLAKASKVSIVLLVVAVACMSGARYLL
jgi:uncharacterized membrane protein